MRLREGEEGVTEEVQELAAKIALVVCAHIISPLHLELDQ
jgi:hypothetical protein